MGFLKKVNVLILGSAVFLAAACGGDENKKEDPAPIHPAQKTCQLIEESNAVAQRYVYNSNGKVDTIWISRAYYHKVKYNAVGNPIEIVGYDLNNAPIGIVTISYNGKGLPESRFSGSLPSGSFSDRNYKYYYNAANQLIKQTIHRKDTVTLNLITYTYPAPNQVISKGYAPGANGYELNYTRHNYYDNMKNPSLLVGYLRDDLISKHNVTKIVHTQHPSNTTSTLDYTYEYNDEGFPLKRIGSMSQYDIYTWNYNCQ